MQPRHHHGRRHRPRHQRCHSMVVDWTWQAGVLAALRRLLQMAGQQKLSRLVRTVVLIRRASPIGRPLGCLSPKLRPSGAPALQLWLTPYYPCYSGPAKTSGVAPTCRWIEMLLPLSWSWFLLPEPAPPQGLQVAEGEAYGAHIAYNVQLGSLHAAHPSLGLHCRLELANHTHATSISGLATTQGWKFQDAMNMRGTSYMSRRPPSAFACVFAP